MEETDTHVNNQVCDHKRYEQKAMGRYTRPLFLTKELREGSRGRKCLLWALRKEQALDKGFLP